MVKLTEEMVVARSRISDLKEVKKLNCWGADLTDVSILRELKKVEVLSLSVNNISGLSDFQFCLNLKELFVRKNNITDLNEVCYLQNLPNLRNLWLGENPCAERKEYRLAVIKALPNLEKLDGIFVDADETSYALTHGKTLHNPLNMDASPSQSVPASPEETAEYAEEVEPEQNRSYSSSSDQRSYDESNKVHEEYHDTDRRNANYNASPPHQYSHNNHFSYEFQNGQTKNQRRDDGVVKSASQTNGEITQTNCIDLPKDYEDRQPVSRQNGSNARDRRSYHEYDRVNEQSNQRPQQLLTSPRSTYSTMEYPDDRRSLERNNYDEDRRHNHIDYEELHHSSQPRRSSSYQSNDREDPRDRETQGWVRHPDKDKCRFHYYRRPVTRNSNILSAVLCLVKELDFPSLEVVEMAVRNRMDELEE